MPIPGNSKVSSRYCATCKLDPDDATCDPGIYWPYHHNYMQCPQCGKTTILKTVDKDLILSTEEAKRKVAYIEFDRWADSESDEDRAKRQARAERQFQREQWEREEEIKLRRQRFDEVISNGGFTQFELDNLKAKERALPQHSNPRYENPLAD